MAAAQVREDCTHPGHVGAHGLAVPGQAVDEGGAARGRRADAPRRPAAAQRRRGAASSPTRVGLPAHPQAAHRRRRARHDARRQPGRARRGARQRFGGQGVDSIAVEEFVEGHEGFYDTISIDGHVALDFVSHYYPNVLEAMRDALDLAAVHRHQPRRLGRRLRRAARAGRAGSTRPSASGRRATHMEWFFGPKGLRFSEIGCRPPGVGAWDLYSAGNDIDIYREWANAIVHGHVAARPSRRYRRRHRRAAAGPRRPRSPATTASTRCRRGPGEWVIDAHLPPPGTPTQPVEAGYMANA